MPVTDPLCPGLVVPSAPTQTQPRCCAAGSPGDPTGPRLHLLVTTSPGGGPKHVYDLVRHLSGDEFEVVVAAPRDGIFFDRFRDLGVPMVELPLSRLGVRHLPLAMRLIKRHGVDIVHTHGKGPGLYGRIGARALGVPAVHTFHGIHYSGYSRAGRDVLERQPRDQPGHHQCLGLPEAEGLGSGSSRMIRAPSC